MTALCLCSAALSCQPAHCNVQRAHAPLRWLCANRGLLAQEVSPEADDFLQVLQSFPALILRAQRLLVHVSYGQTFHKVDQDVKGEAIHQGVLLPQHAVDAVESQRSTKPFEGTGVNSIAEHSLQDGFHIGRVLLHGFTGRLLDGPWQEFTQTPVKDYTLL